MVRRAAALDTTYEKKKKNACAIAREDCSQATQRVVRSDLHSEERGRVRVLDEDNSRETTATKASEHSQRHA